MTDTLRRLAALGYVGPPVSLALLVLSTVLDPLFSWRSRSLSSIGEATGTAITATTADQLAFSLFNGGLLVAGLLGVGFAAVLWVETATRLERVGVGVLAVTMLSNVGVAVAYLDGPFTGGHFVAALGVFFGLTVTMWVYGTALVRRTGGEHGLPSIWMANVHILAWVFWMIAEALVFTGDGDTWTYFAVPEFVGASLLGLWVVVQAWRVRRSPGLGARVGR